MTTTNPNPSRPSLIAAIKDAAQSAAIPYRLDVQYCNMMGTIGFAIQDDARLIAYATPNWDSEYPCPVEIQNNDLCDIAYRADFPAIGWTGDDAADAAIFCREVVPLVAALLRLHAGMLDRATPAPAATAAERATIIADCRDACRTNVLRTDDEARALRERAQSGATRLGYDAIEDVAALSS